MTIQAAADYAILQPAGSEDATELYPDVAAVGAIYGDPANKYAAWLNAAENATYVEDASFLWNQPLSDSGLAAGIEAAASASAAAAAASASGGASGSGSGAGASPTDKGGVGAKENGALGAVGVVGGAVYALCAVAALALL